MNSSKKQTGRFAGVLYLLLAITAAYAIVYVPSQIEVSGNETQTVGNIVAKEFLYRTGTLSHLISQVIFVLLGITFYRFLKEVHESKARLMLALVLVQIPVVFIIEALKLTAVMVAKGELLQQFTAAQAQDIAVLLLKTHGNGIAVLELFWGLWLIPLAQLVYRSGFMPKFLVLLLMAGGLAYIIESITLILFPDTHKLVIKFTFIFYSLAEISLILWLLIIGAKNKPVTT